MSERESIEVRDLHAWATRMPDGRLSLIGILTEHGHLPMVAFDAQRLIELESVAREHGRLLGQTVYFLRFSHSSVLAQFEP